VVQAVSLHLSSRLKACTTIAMAISVERIRADIEAIARCTETPGKGASRPTFSAAWGAARQYVIDQARQAGCEVRTDAAGNLHVRPKSLAQDAPAWLCGSHIDSVPHGGDYDGVAGVVVGLELLRSAQDEGVASPLELIVFAEEEGTAFGLGMIGSRAWVGELTPEQLAALHNSRGESYIVAGGAYGVLPDRLSADRIRPADYLGLVEVHIEQGPGMWRTGERLAVVRYIAGRIQAHVTYHGEANHAGATSMQHRHDALAGAADVVVRLEALAHQMGEGTVITVGRLDVQPSAVNVIARQVDFTIDLRAPAQSLLEEGEIAFTRIVHEAAGRRSLGTTFRVTERIWAQTLDDSLCDKLARSAHAVGFQNLPTAISGALHDSAILAPHIPTAMLFVPSRDGISHNPAEFSRAEDIAAAAEAVQRFVRRPTLQQLNAMDQPRFVSVCGPLFEHSPWIGQRAWERRRPFASPRDLHEKLCSIVASATPDEQLSLLRAHPDLVGRLAREGRLTRESTAEQAAAGLTSLSDDQIATFERLNTQYREKFGFPFIICARENKKDAILAAFPQRLANTRAQEIAAALAEIYKIARLRLSDAIWED
jgi:allantoate deiminase